MNEATTRIITAKSICDPPGPYPEAFVIRSNRVAERGSISDLRAKFPGAEFLDFGDCCILPGLNDAHQHPTLCAENDTRIDLTSSKTGDISDILTAIRKRATAIQTGGWVIGAGYNASKTTGAHLDRWVLDDACRTNPVLIIHESLHAGTLNSEGLAQAGWAEASDAPAGGRLAVNSYGELTGVIHDQALYDLAFPAFTARRTVVNEAATEPQAERLLEHLHELHSVGLTSVTDALISPRWWRVLEQLDRTDRFAMRLSCLGSWYHFEFFDQLGRAEAAQDSRLTLRGIKLFVDGSLNEGTCLVEEPVIGSGQPGVARVSREDLFRIVDELHTRGWRACIHANGDRAVRWALDAIDAAQQGKWSPRRHRIEHAAIVTRDSVERMAALGVVAVPYSQYPIAHGENLRRLYGPERLERMFAHRLMLDDGVMVAGSSDHPCGPVPPLVGIQSCVTRVTASGQEFGPSQRIAVEEALRLYTEGSAQAEGCESEKGHLLPGFVADFVVLEADPRRVPAVEISTIPIRETWIGGAQVWHD